jgi:hypothetical protein
VSTAIAVAQENKAGDESNSGTAGIHSFSASILLYKLVQQIYLMHFQSLRYGQHVGKICSLSSLRVEFVLCLKVERLGSVNVDKLLVEPSGPERDLRCVCATLGRDQFVALREAR